MDVTVNIFNKTLKMSSTPRFVPTADKNKKLIW